MMERTKEGRKEGREGGREGGRKEGRKGGREEGRKGGRKEGGRNNLIELLQTKGLIITNIINQFYTGHHFICEAIQK